MERPLLRELFRKVDGCLRVDVMTLLEEFGFSGNEKIISVQSELQVLQHINIQIKE